MRAIGAAYAGILTMLLLAMGSASRSPIAVFTRDVMLIGLAPLLVVGLDPPRWLRRYWRAGVQSSLEEAMQGLFSVRDRHRLAEHCVSWSCRLVGGDRGICVLGGTTLASQGLTPGAADELASVAGRGGLVQLGSDTFAIVCPIRVLDRDGKIVVVSGPFTPAFGQAEIDALQRFAHSFASALEHAILFDLLKEETTRADVLLKAQSDLGEGVVVVEDLRIVYANDAYCRMTGYRLEELQALDSALDLASAEERELLADRCRRREAGERVPNHYETSLIHRDGERRHVEIAVAELRVDGRFRTITIVRDVTDRRCWEERLKESNAKLKAVIAASPLPIVAVDRAGVVRMWNPAAVRMFGWTEDEVLGRFNPIYEGAGEVGSAMARVADGETVIEFETVRRRKDGSVVEVSVSAAPWNDGRGLASGVISILADITERKRLEEALVESGQRYAEAYEQERRATERLRALDSMKDTFLTAVSHELRTPLTTVLGFATTLENDGHRLSPSQHRMVVQRISSNAQRLERLLSDLLDLDRLRRGILEPRRRQMNLSVLVGRVIEGSDISARRTVHLHADPVVVDVDAAMIERVIENLLSNADRYTPPGSDVWVSVSRDVEGAVIEVADEGPGVPPDLREVILEPFQQGLHAHGHSPGVGVGLSLVSRFAEAHGGRVEVGDRPGGGASFRVHLPTGPVGSVEEVAVTAPDRAVAS
ncbi:MAG TPA: PAS domain S-box protein [Actinomycetota bacterium]|nr:PAS domain S-box protein [Actinomycetota bacterium]